MQKLLLQVAWCGKAAVDARVGKRRMLCEPASKVGTALLGPPRLDDFCTSQERIVCVRQVPCICSACSAALPFCAHACERSHTNARHLQDGFLCLPSPIADLQNAAKYAAAKSGGWARLIKPLWLRGHRSIFFISNLPESSFQHDHFSTRSCGPSMHCERSDGSPERGAIRHLHSVCRFPIAS